MKFKKIQNNMSSICLTASNKCNIVHANKSKNNEDSSITNKINILKLCDNLIIQAESRFNKHLTAALVFQNEKYLIFNNRFSN